MSVSKFKFFILFVMLCVGLITKIFANTTDTCCNAPAFKSNHQYSLYELSDLALTHNPATQLAWAQIKAATAGVGLAKAAYWPTISASANSQYRNNSSGSGFDSSDNNDDDFNNDNTSSTNNGSQSSGNSNFTYGPNLSLSYLLLDFGTRKAKVANAHFQLVAACFNQDDAIQQVILSVEQAYYQLLGQQALVIANEKNRSAAQTSLAAATALHQQGLSTIGDVYQAKSVLAQAELTLNQTKGLLKDAQGQLATAAGLPVNAPLQLTDIPRPLQFAPLMKNMQHLLTLAAMNRPDLNAAKAQIHAATANVVAAQRQYWPTVQLSANTSQMYPDETNRSRVLVSLNVPIFTGFSTYYTVKQAQGLEEQAVAQKNILNNQIELQVWQAYYGLQTAYQSIQSSNVLLESSELAAKQALGQYKAGVGNILSVLSTQNAEANARAQNIQTKLNWFLALSQLAKSLGILDVKPPTAASIGSL